MKKNRIIAAFLTLLLCSPLAAQEEKRHGGFGGDRSDRDSWDGAREKGNEQDKPNSDDQLKHKPSADKRTMNQENRAARPARNLGGGTPANKGRGVNSPERGNNGNPWGGQQNSNAGNQRSRTIHRFNNGNPGGQQGQEGGWNNFRSKNNEGRQDQGDANRSFRSRSNEDHDRVGGGNQQDRSKGWGPVRHEVSPGMRRIGIKRIPANLPAHDRILRADAEHSRFTPPSVGPKGQAMKAKLLLPQKGNATVIQAHMKSFGMNATFINQVNIYNNQETISNHYYWHTWNGTSYCHYYDPWGYHWYGWYWNGSCFWSRWYGGYWWWYDPYYSRWCYWNDGNWWWNDPYHVDVVYVYHDGDYVSSASTSVEAPEPAQAAEVDFKSRDGSRTVKLFGEDAFLYDTDQDGMDNKPVYLASGVKEVKFSKPGMGKPLQIMLILNDGSFEMFDSDGNPYNNPQDQP